MMLKSTLLSKITGSLLALYLLLHLFPQLAFGNNLTYGTFIIYSHTKPDKRIYAILDSAAVLLNKSELHNSELQPHTIFLCNSSAEFMFWAPTHFSAFAVNFPFSNHIFIALPNILLNKALRNSNKNNQRTLSGTIAHEVTHTLIREHLGLLKALRLSTWKQEGYCDFIARESSFPATEGNALFCQSLQSETASFQYFKYRLLTSYLMQVKKVPFRNFAQAEIDPNALESTVREQYCR